MSNNPSVHKTFIGQLVSKRIYSVRLRIEILDALQQQIDSGKWTFLNAPLLGMCFHFDSTEQGAEYWLEIHDKLHGPGSLTAGKDLYFQNIESNKL